MDKKLHNTTGNNYLQSVDYRYNIRGWLTSINNDKLTSDSGTTNDETNDYFGLEMVYNKPDSTGNALFYNGNISAIKWKNVGKSGYANRRSYKYGYDKSDKLKAATFQAHTGANSSSSWSKEAGTLNETMTYDHNGNMMTLARKRNNRSLVGASTAATVDNLSYGYAANSNSLLTVQDTDTAGWFKNPVSTSSEYAHNSDGSLTRDDNKGVSSIAYNFLGKPQVVTFTNGKKVEYVYDAAGIKLTMKTWQGTTLQTLTNYAGGFVYEGSTPALSYFSSPEGRVVKTGSTYEYQYSIADHQGNTRVVFTSAPASPQSYFADMEAATNSNFSNYNSRVNFDLMDKTDVGYDGSDYAQKLYGNAGSQVGVAKSFKVYPGDKVSIRAYAKYYDATSTTSNLSGFASALISAFGVSAPGSGEAANSWSALNSYGATVAGGGGHEDNSGSYPKAYVNLIAVDKKYNFLDGAWDQISGGRQIGATPTAHDEMYQEYVAREEGWVYVFVSNENPTLVEVYFDDVTVTITPGNVIQGNEYYPYGLQTATSWTRESNVANNFLYNGGTELNQTTQVYDLYYRNYDPVLGRFGQVDPKASKYGAVSPYHFAGNNPTVFNDPMGDDYINDTRAGLPAGPHDTSNGLRMYRSSDPYGHMTSRRFYAQHLDWLASHPTDYQRKEAMEADARWVRRGRMSLEEYASNHGSHVSDSKFGMYAAAANFAKGNYIRGLTRLIGLVKLGMYLEAQQIKAAPMIASLNGMEDLGPQTGGEGAPVVVDNTSEAWDHYMNGNGSSVDIGPNSINALINGGDFKVRHDRIISGMTTALSGSFPVNMTSSVFHIGRTNVDYSIQCSGGDCYVEYTLFRADGFWDVDFIDENIGGRLGIDRYQPDRLGPNLERFGGTPYPYNTTTSGFYFKNPGY